MEKTQEVVAYHSAENTMQEVFISTHKELYLVCNDKEVAISYRPLPLE
jgi:hypothetical protein